MGSYHSSFSYLKKNSAEEGFIIAAFEADDGEYDTFLGMDQITTDSYDGAKKFFYGNRFNTQPIISITIIKADGTDFSVADNRRALRWLTGARQASWLDFYEGDKLAYCFYGNFTASYQQKMGARVIGIRLEFSSLYPWAYSSPQPNENDSFSSYIGEEMLVVDKSVLYKGEEFLSLGVDDNGVIYNGSVDEGKTFNITNDGLLYNDISVIFNRDNESDDLYTYIYLNVEYVNQTATVLTICNNSILDLNGNPEITRVENLSANEVITISSGQFIISDIPHKIFGDTFNFVWPRLQPGENNLTIDADGKGMIKFSYRYPIKIGDCAIDIQNLIGDSALCG